MNPTARTVLAWVLGLAVLLLILQLQTSLQQSRLAADIESRPLLPLQHVRRALETAPAAAPAAVVMIQPQPAAPTASAPVTSPAATAQAAAESSPRHVAAPVPAASQNVSTLTLGKTARLASSEADHSSPASLMLVNLPPAAASESDKPTAVNKAGSKTHVIAAGEGLWNISQKHYGQGTHWRNILEANRDVISNPKRLPVGKQIVIPAI